MTICQILKIKWVHRELQRLIEGQKVKDRKILINKMIQPSRLFLSLMFRINKLGKAIPK